ncbi:MAG: hypothetical protein ACJAQS_001723, partial [Porticoccus sp.]
QALVNSNSVVSLILDSRVFCEAVHVIYSFSELIATYIGGLHRDIVSNV